MAFITISRLQMAMFFYLIIISLLIAYRPPLMFTAEKEPKTWAVENTATTSIMAPAFSFPVLAFLCYYVAVLIEGNI